MPLSEQEQRLLDEMERHLMRNDADVVTTSRDGRGLSYRNIVYGTLLVLLGLGGLIVGVAVPLIVVGVIGFVVMLAGVVVAVTPTRNGTVKAADAAPSGAGQVPSGRGSFMDRMNERWDRRQGDR